MLRRIISAIVFVGLSCSASTPTQAAPPNILFILSDDHSVPFLGCYGDPTVQTPNLDRFAGEGARFNKAFTVAPQCSTLR